MDPNQAQQILAAMDSHQIPWDDNLRAAANKALGGGSSSGGGGFQPLKPPDVAKLREEVYNTLKPYYMQLAKEAQGDFDRAVSILREDYAKNTRDHKAVFAFKQNEQIEGLK